MIGCGLRILRCASILGAAALLNRGCIPQTQNETSSSTPKPRALVLLSERLPRLDGSRLKTMVLVVNYGPGEASMAHRHPCAVIGYVTQGAIRTQIKGESEATLQTGQSFYEAPNAVHLVSANASHIKPASFLAVFICDHDAPLSSDVKPDRMPGGKQ